MPHGLAAAQQWKPRDLVTVGHTQLQPTLMKVAGAFQALATLSARASAPLGSFPDHIVPRLTHLCTLLLSSWLHNLCCSSSGHPVPYSNDA